MSKRSIGQAPNRLLNAVKRRAMGTITHVSTPDPVVALTFDDGPHAERTPQLLDILCRHRARATFFMVGEAAHRHPALVREVASAGHLIGNHSWDHPSFPLISGRERRRQVRACAEALGVDGQRMFRPPFGHQSVASRLDLLRLGYRVVTWNVVARDWLDRDRIWIADQVASQLRPGSIVLLHETLYAFAKEQHVGRQSTFEAVDLLLERFGERFQFVTVSELLRHGKPQLRNWYRKADPDWVASLRRPQTIRGGM
jgi:peptidoglycan/xylan/chitin deacetylase (PgdA/CDA1 family)